MDDYSKQTNGRPNQAGWPQEISPGFVNQKIPGVLLSLFVFFWITLFLSPPGIAQAQPSPPTGFKLMDGVLSWDANTEPDLAGYKVHWDEDSGPPYANTLDVGNVTSLELTQLNLDEGTYYSAITAYDTSDRESDFSNEVIFQKDGAVSVSIDIMPGNSPNSINLKSAGVIPVAIISSDTFDATQVDPETVSLAGARVNMVGKSGRLLCHTEDVT